jgi:hypothetical protein
VPQARPVVQIKRQVWHWSNRPTEAVAKAIGEVTEYVLVERGKTQLIGCDRPTNRHDPRSHYRERTRASRGMLSATWTPVLLQTAAFGDLPAYVPGGRRAET